MSKATYIGIFEGKKTEYNLLILEVLFKNGPSTAWEIAKGIMDNRGETKDRDILYSRTQHIYSVIARKGARLEDLNKKDYILQKNSKWELCFPKGLAILIRKPELLDKINDYYLQSFQLNGALRSKTLSMPFGLQLRVDGQKFQNKAKSMIQDLNRNRIETFLGMVKSLEKLIQQGIDIDRIDNKSLLVLVIQNMEAFLSNLHGLMKSRNQDVT
jgi:hypothetical protein